MKMMTEDGTSPQISAPHELAHALAPALRDACEGQLGPIRWFKADWQRGGAATGYSTFTFDGEADPREVVIKFPVGPREHRFTTVLAQTKAPTPRIAAEGTEIGGYDLAWLVMERLPGDPLATDRHKDVILELTDAAARFHQHATPVAPTGVARPVADWESLLEQARQAVRDNPISEAQRWSKALKQTAKALPNILRLWLNRPMNAWCHGDVHAGNAMRRDENSPWGPAGCILLDLAETHPGHWIEDAVYLERIYWGHPESLHDLKPVKLIAHARRENGLELDADYADLADIRRVLMAACVPAFLHREGSPRYLAAALEKIETITPRFV